MVHPAAPRARGSTPVVAAALVGAMVTGLVAGLPGLRFAYESLEAHVALESAQGVIALLLAYLAVGRMRITRELPDLVLALAFAAFAATNLFVSALPVALHGDTVEFTTWTAAGLRLVAVSAFALAALVPRRRLPARGLAARSIAVSLGAVGLVLALAAVADATLAELIDPELSPDDSGAPLFSGHPVAVAIQMLGTALMTTAAIAFAIRAHHTRDDLVRWLAAGATLGAFARLNYVLFPSLYTDWFYTGDVLRLGSYLLFLAGAAREIGSYWQRQAQLAVLEERRRMARELHDGLSQELTFLRSQLASATDRGMRPEMVPFVAEAADRALVESRKVFAALTGPEDIPLAEALRRAAEEVAARSGAVVDVTEGAKVITPIAARRELERIVREATTNAVRHGSASTVRVSVGAAGPSLTVRVEDDGTGFDVGTSDRNGFGLTSMRERAQRLGGTLSIESAPGDGSTVEVVVPRHGDLGLQDPQQIIDARQVDQT